MKTMMRTGAAALALCAMVGQSWAAGVCTPAKDAMVAGSQPIVQSNSFDSRFSAMK